MRMSKGYSDGSADVDGVVPGLGAHCESAAWCRSSARLTAMRMDVLDAPATVLTGTPDYQWYECEDAAYTNPTAIGSATSATYDTSSEAGYYFCVVTVLITDLSTAKSSRLHNTLPPLKGGGIL